MSVSDRVRALVEPVVSPLGLEVVDVEHAGATLRVSVDRPGGVDLDTISAASEAVSAVLDGADPVPGRYTLEVSSPGVERPLRTPDHFRRAVGTPVSVRTLPGVEGERRVEGLLSEADDEAVVVAGRRLAYGDIERARTVFEWGPSPKPTGPTRRKKKKKAATS
jgi:ribosome maturation factor RimP